MLGAAVQRLEWIAWLYDNWLVLPYVFLALLYLFWSICLGAVFQGVEKLLAEPRWDSLADWLFFTVPCAFASGWMCVLLVCLVSILIFASNSQGAICWSVCDVFFVVLSHS